MNTASKIIGRDYSGKIEHLAVGSITPRQRRIRLGLMVLFSGLWISLIIARLVSLQITDFEKWQDWATKQHLANVTLASERGRIIDRNNRLMAVSVPASSVYVRPKQVRNQALVIKELSATLNISQDKIREKLSGDSPFIWIKRQLPRAQVENLVKLRNEGVGIIAESRRYYPFGSAASSLIGKVGVDGNGLSGLELVYDSELKGKEYEATFSKDAFGNIIDKEGDSIGGFNIPKGSSLRLSIDANFQSIMDEEIHAGLNKANAKRVYAVMMDAENGEILGMSQSPSHDFNSTKPVSLDSLKNHILEMAYEPGSTFKPIVAAAAIDAGLISPNNMINCEGGSFYFAKHIINDVHPSKIISLHDVIVRSSNIGIAKVGMLLGREKLYKSIRDFGFGEKSGLPFQGESKGIFRSVETWANIDIATHSYGQGIAVTPMQLLRAFSSLANGGYLVTPTVIAGKTENSRRQIISTQAAESVKKMLYDVVEDEEGTGGNAKITGVKVGGKTGTAQKAKSDGRGYSQGSYIASFVGFVDAKQIGIDRIFSLIVIVDEPNTTSIYGGTLAAPIFKRIMQRSLYNLSTVRDEPRGNDGVVAVSYPAA